MSEDKFKPLDLGEFETDAFRKDDAVTLKSFGHGIVAKVERTEEFVHGEGDEPDDWVPPPEAKFVGKRTLYFLFEPDAMKVPSKKEDAIGRHVFLSDGLIGKNGTYYSQSGDHFVWPKGIAHAPPDDSVGKLWKEAQRRRVQMIVGCVFPEALTGVLVNRGYLKTLTGPCITTTDLDDLQAAGISQEPYVGWKVAHDMLGVGTLVKLDKRGVEKYAVEWKKKCMNGKCQNPITFKTMSGCHPGAYCYVCDDKGKYLADLRNQMVFCDTCSEKNPDPEEDEE